MLEKSVSGLPDSFGGNFLLVSGIRYKFDHRKIPKVQVVQIKPPNIGNEFWQVQMGFG